MNELKRDKLYLLEIEYGCEREDGSVFMARSLLVGFLIGKEDNYFFGSVYDKDDDGYYGGGDTMRLTKEEFNEYVKSVKEIA